MAMYRLTSNARSVISLLLAAAVSSAYGQAPATEMFSTDWSHGIDRRLLLQQATPDAIRVVRLARADMDTAVLFTISRNTDYQRVANGTPRAELSFNRFLHFERGKDYVIQWQILIPDGYRFDTQQPELIAQIHQGPAAGYPPFALFIAGNGQYEVHNRTHNPRDSVTRLFGSPMDDRGRVVNWMLRYVPDDSGRLAVTELFEDGRSVFRLTGLPNAYPDDDRAYLKLGIYKASWQRAPTDVEQRSLYYGRVTVQQRER
jgi:hypothetical protein